MSNAYIVIASKPNDTYLVSSGSGAAYAGAVVAIRPLGLKSPAKAYALAAELERKTVGHYIDSNARLVIRYKVTPVPSALTRAYLCTRNRVCLRPGFTVIPRLRRSAKYIS